MENLIKRTWRELNEEAAYVTFHLRRWWNGMEDGEQLFFVGVLCAAFLLIGMRRPTNYKYKQYDEPGVNGLLKQFMFAAVILIVFTFGIETAVDSF